jgi:hypothetical protein
VEVGPLTEDDAETFWRETWGVPLDTPPSGNCPTCGSPAPASQREREVRPCQDPWYGTT